VVGHSMGGAIAQALALRRLPQLARLVLVGTAARLRVAEAILTGILPQFEATVDLIIRFAWGPNAPAPLAARARERMLAVDPAVFQRDFLACDAFDVREQVAQIELPTLVICGTEDKMTPLKHGRFLAEQIPQATLVTLDGAGHYLPLEQPQAVAAAITQFLEAAGDA
jgi:pimeloyl-ACP methyl ester carboxylesterase